MADLTPMMKQYFETKKNYPDTIIFFRLGDFYEMFHQDAITVSRELGLTLTTRDRNKPIEERTPMCGIPYHSAENYVATLIEKGYKVAICEQMQDPASTKGLVERDVVRVVTAGTVMESSMLDESKNNYLAVVYSPRVSELAERGGSMALALCDISTGDLCVKEVHFTDDIMSGICNELGRFQPREVVVNDGCVQQRWIMDFINQGLKAPLEEREGFLENVGRKSCLNLFGEDKIPTSSAILCCLGGLFQYLGETQKTDLNYITKITSLNEERFMEVDLVARRNLELTETLWNREKKGSLLWVLDKTKTSMGGRLLQEWMKRPLLSVVEIEKRQEAIGEAIAKPMEHSQIRDILKGVPDLERIMARISYGNGGAKELRSLGQGLQEVQALKKVLSGMSTVKCEEIQERLDPLEDMSSLLLKALKEELPVSVREGNFVAEGFHPEVDKLRHILNYSQEVITEMEEKTKEETGIRNLRVRNNKVFGYYIEVAKAQSANVPAHWVRKQTTVNSERFISEELKELEQTIVTAKDQVVTMEYEIFQRLREEACRHISNVQSTARAIAELDVLCSLATVAVAQNYVAPTVTEGSHLHIEEGRHPVVELLAQDGLFVPNDTHFEEEQCVCAIITGPNMAGKSTYMRQVALIVIMAQMGGYVPAKSASIGLVDRVFTRIGASDDLAGGRSTFMVEMAEVAQLLSSATEKSLLILDEIGRGTSTYDGMAIAKAVLEHCRKEIGAKTLFATHYHELATVEQELDGVVNYNIAAKQKGDRVIFLRKILQGSADQSYGVQVAKLAGVPEPVVQRAFQILSQLESGEQETGTPRSTTVESTYRSPEEEREQAVVDAMRQVDLDDISPRDALTLLTQWKEKLSE